MKCLLIGVVLILATSSAFDCLKVNWEIYYESMCPGCRFHFVKVYGPIRQAIGKYLNITLVPCGAEHVSESGEVTCQHGELECFGNAVHACALDMYDFDKAFEYIECMFKSHYTNPPYVARKCAKSMNLDYNKILTCANGTKGLELIKRNEKKTNSLIPKIYYIPWEVINGKHLSCEVDTLRYICDNFLKDLNLPACKSSERIRKEFSELVREK